MSITGKTKWLCSKCKPSHTYKGIFSTHKTFHHPSFRHWPVDLCPRKDDLESRLLHIISKFFHSFGKVNFY